MPALLRMPWHKNFAIDLGTAFIRIAAERSAVVSIPTLGMSSPPLFGGFIVNPLSVTAALRPYLASRWHRPSVLVGAPTGIRSEERAALVTALQQAGAAHVEIFPEPQASAIGAGLDLSSPFAQMIVDVGEGVTDCAIFKEGRIVASLAGRVGCGSLRRGVQEEMVHNRGLRPTSAEAERIVSAVGAGELAEQVITVGLDADYPLAEIAAFLQPVFEAILAIPTTLLQQIPHELGCEVIESGIVLTGGGALLPGFARRLAKATDIHVTIPVDPLNSVVAGLQTLLSESHQL
jgi:rod shape-determining protein MreB and related proteins